MSILLFQDVLKNKYFRWYSNIIGKAINEKRVYDSKIHEMHHVFPKSFGGGEESNNYIALTFKEHYICHALLPKFTKGKEKMKMCFALHSFFHFDSNRKLKITRGKLYEAHKKMFFEACKEREARVKPEIFRFKHIDTKQEFIGTRSEFRVHSGLTSQEVYNLLRPNSKMFHCKRWGVFRESSQQFSFEKDRYKPKMPVKSCKFCHKEVTSGNFSRWHGEKCKFKP